MEVGRATLDIKREVSSSGLEVLGEEGIKSISRLNCECSCESRSWMVNGKGGRRIG